MDIDPREYKYNPEDLPDALKMFTGNTIQLWHFTSSHCMVTFRIYESSVSEKYLVLNFVEYLRCETMCKIKAPNVHTLENGDSVLEDETYRITFRECFIYDENPKNLSGL